MSAAAALAEEAPEVIEETPPIPCPFAVGLLYMLRVWPGLGLGLFTAKSALEMLCMGSLTG